MPDLGMDSKPKALTKSSSEVKEEEKSGMPVPKVVEQEKADAKEVTVRDIPPMIEESKPKKTGVKDATKKEKKDATEEVKTDAGDAAAKQEKKTAVK